MMSRIKTVRVLARLFPAVFLSLLVCWQVHAAGSAKTDKRAPDMNVNLVKSDSPINITADRMEAKQDDRTIVFEGHVVVVQDDMTITANRLKVTALPGEKQAAPSGAPPTEKSASSAASPTEKIDFIEFEGDVKVTQQDRLATANKAIFYQKEQKIVMNGRPVVTKGQDRVEGDLITIYLQQGRSIVESGSGAPVKAVLFPGKKE
jgi:lipopolysaccharide export system protein LptA